MVEFHKVVQVHVVVMVVEVIPIFASNAKIELIAIWLSEVI